VNNALQGKHVLVTRPTHQAECLCRLIEEQAGVAVRFPTLEIVGIDARLHNPQGSKPLANYPLRKLSNYRWLIFVSANAVNFALKAIGGKIAQFEPSKMVAIGQATARALELASLSVAIIPERGFDSESLLAMPQMQDVEGQDILIVRGQGGREALASGLRSRGANVEYWEVYQRLMPDTDATETLSLLGQGRLDAIIVTSGEALQNLVAMLGAEYKKKLATVPLVVISDRINRLAVELGFKRVAVTESPSDLAILETAIAIINGE
jgi:uroporphyrinogen-III synthase